jgi:hypothetical protein
VVTLVFLLRRSLDLERCPIWFTDDHPIVEG